MTDLAPWPPGGSPNVIFDGDSLQAGQLGPLGRRPGDMTMSGFDSRATWSTVALGGQTMLTILTNGAAAVDPLFLPGKTNIVVLRISPNDFYFDSAVTAVTVLGYIQAYVAARHAAGWRVIVSTCTPRSDPPTPGNFDSRRLTLNAAIRAAPWIDAVADVGGDPLMGTLGQETDTRYYDSTLVHNSQVGYRLVADYFKAALAKLGVTSDSDRRVLAPRRERVFVPAALMQTTGATAAVRTPIGAAALDTWALPAAGTSLLTFAAEIPEGWLTMALDVLTINNIAASVGNVSLTGFCQWVRELTNLYAGLHVPPPGVAVVAAAGAFAFHHIINLWINEPVDSTCTFVNLDISRTGGGADTYPQPLYVLGAQLRQLS